MVNIPIQKLYLSTLNKYFYSSISQVYLYEICFKILEIKHVYKFTFRIKIISTEWLGNEKTIDGLVPLFLHLLG